MSTKVRRLRTKRSNFDGFIARHSEFVEQGVLIPEPNDVMQNSYLLLDENLAFLNCSAGGRGGGTRRKRRGEPGLDRACDAEQVFPGLLSVDLATDAAGA